MPPLINEMINTIDLFISKDLPFLPVERATRVSKLKEDFGKSDVSTAEKYRKALEAFQIENDYGRSIESYEGVLVTEDGERTVNFLRLAVSRFTTKPWTSRKPGCGMLLLVTGQPICLPEPVIRLIRRMRWPKSLCHRIFSSFPFQLLKTHE